MYMRYCENINTIKYICLIRMDCILNMQNSLYKISSNENKKFKNNGTSRNKFKMK
jgi:hypothetical protein